jgi:GH24 family phage-related lysozyme (muramidase)
MKDPIPQDPIQGLMQVLPRFEGNVSHMYLDTAGLVTVGIGHMIPNLQWAQEIPFVARATCAPASAAQIAADFQAVAAALKGQAMPTYQHITALNLVDGWAIAEAAGRLRQEYLPALKAQYPDYDGYPPSAQEALLDMIYNLGAGGLAKFGRLKAAVVAGQWQVAARDCHRMGIQQARNDWAVAQFLAAVS